MTNEKITTDENHATNEEFRAAPANDGLKPEIFTNDKLSWCCRQRRGIALTEPKPHLSEAYLREADETLANVLVTSGKWKVIIAYYACYHALYAILVRCGIRSEIHECTLALMERFPFTDEERVFLAKLKEDRIQTQYYLRERIVDEEAMKRFVATCKRILDGLTSEEIEDVRFRLTLFTRSSSSRSVR